MTDRVYHFSSTLQLPWIVSAGELQPCSFGGPTDNYIWATSNPEYEHTASAFHLDDWFELGAAQIVRFTLNATDFVHWDEIRKTPLWAGADVEMLKRRDKCAREGCGEHDPSKWYLRRELLPLTSVLRIDARPCGGRWRRIKPTRKNCIDITDDPPTMAFIIDGFHHYSTRFQYDDGDFGYVVPDRDELREMFEAKEYEDWDDES